MGRNLYEVYLEEGFCGVDGVGDMTATQYEFVLASKRDKAERKQEAQEKAQRRAQRSH
ncbi:hypothetical protein [Halococcus saccharolyticus]|uniref:hypothetical protein n=1 Tax=Halococcus saccharolyticus TaxID=62319 RepID=UPI000ADBFB14|nr:hypothetical protein [Halococcus saccharolyticus]